MRVVNLNKGSILGENISYAETLISRLIGLLNRDKLDKGEGLILVPCKMVHTFGMKFPLDIVFISKTYVVLYIIEDIMPYYMSPYISSAYGVIELPTGTISRTNTKEGDRISIS